jgi:hypothetical protein
MIKKIVSFWPHQRLQHCLQKNHFPNIRKKKVQTLCAFVKYRKKNWINWSPMDNTFIHNSYSNILWPWVLWISKNMISCSLENFEVMVTLYIAIPLTNTHLPFCWQMSICHSAHKYISAIQLTNTYLSFLSQ